MTPPLDCLAEQVESLAAKDRQIAALTERAEKAEQERDDAQHDLGSARILLDECRRNGVQLDLYKQRAESAEAGQRAAEAALAQFRADAVNAFTAADDVIRRLSYTQEPGPITAGYYDAKAKCLNSTDLCVGWKSPGEWAMLEAEVLAERERWNKYAGIQRPAGSPPLSARDAELMRAIFAGPEDEPMTTEPMNTYSPKHPHEPAVPPVLDAEGCCLVCRVMVRDEEIAKLDTEISRPKAAHEEAIKELQDKLIECAQTWNAERDQLRQELATVKANYHNCYYGIGKAEVPTHLADENVQLRQEVERLQAGAAVIRERAHDSGREILDRLKVLESLEADWRKALSTLTGGMFVLAGEVKRWKDSHRNALAELVERNKQVEDANATNERLKGLLLSEPGYNATWQQHRPWKLKVEAELAGQTKEGAT